MNVNRFANLYSLFQFAVSQKLKYPKIRLQHPDGNDTVIVKLAGEKSKYCGQLMVTNDAGFGSMNNRYFGRIDNNGAIFAGRDLTPALEALLEEFAANPVEVAQRYGKLTGNCMFCGKPLDDPTSVACGYGPVCAKKWHLPHSASKQSRASRKAAETLLHEEVSQLVKKEEVMSWVPEVIADNSGKWCGNGLRFATREEAEANVRDLMCRWTLVRETRVVESTDPVNYRWTEKGLEKV